MLKQEGGGRIQLEEDGAITLHIPLEEVDQRRGSQISFPAVIEETVLAKIMAALNYASWLLDLLDPAQRLAEIACAVTLDASDYMSWRTRREQDASPTGGTMLMYGHEQREPVSLHKPRPALRLDRQRFAKDLLVPLRRQWKRS